MAYGKSLCFHPNLRLCNYFAQVIPTAPTQNKYLTFDGVSSPTLSPLVP